MSVVKTPRRWMVGVLAVAVLSVSACTSATSGTGSMASGRSSATPPASGGSPSSSASSGSDSSSGGTSSCPASYLQPDPHRPRMDLDFTVSDDHTTVQGIEKIAFTPDKSITELVFRLTANTKPTVAQGNKIVVNSASADHGGGTATYSKANAAAGTQGGLLHIPFKERIPAGTTVNADVTFTLTLGKDSFDRFGQAGAYAYFASAQPLLSWERGYGWHTEDLINFTAESATSEAMKVNLTVHAPSADTVIASGDPADPPASSGERTWTSSLNSARDVSVALGPFSVSDTTVDGVKLRLGAPDMSTRDQLVPEFKRAITRLSQRFGPFPFPSLSVARVPAQGGGIEYPSSILMLDGSQLVAVHETAHQWFYAMVGDSQSRDPWLDEAFATYSEELVDNDAPNDGAINATGTVDSSVQSYGKNVNDYYFTTYNKGAAALLAARKASGAQAWDAAVRCYVAANAWRIAVPGDFEKAIAKFPRGIAILKKAGALK